MSELIKKYNTQDTALVITSYASRGTKKDNPGNAISWHSKQTLSALAKHRKVLICAESPHKEDLYEADTNILVQHIWKKGNIFSFLHLFAFILKQDKIQTIFVQFEFNVMGGILPNLALLFLLFLLKLCGKFIVFELHQVIRDVGQLQKHVPLGGRFIQRCFNVGLHAFYTILGMTAHRIIVFEEELKERLTMIPSTKIYVQSLAVHKNNIIDTRRAKKLIGRDPKEFTILVFGYINGYKGLDWIIRTIGEQKPRNVRLVIAGGKNPYLAGKAYYEQFYAHIRKLITRYPNVTYANFIPEDDVHIHFSAADIVALPYEVFMSASGPFSLSLSYGKAILLSTVLTKYTNSSDFARAMRKTRLSTKELFFSQKEGQFLKLLDAVQHDTKRYNKLSSFSQSLRDERHIDRISEKLHHLLQPTTAHNVALSFMDIVPKINWKRIG